MFFFVQVNGVCICFYVTDVKCVSDCHVTLQSILQRMRCLRYDGDLRSVDGYIRKIWEDDRPFWNIRADISRSRLALSGEYNSSEQSSRQHICL